MIHVLLVEDKAADRELLTEALSSRGARVTCANTDLEAYAALESGEAFDILVSDINLGFGTTGYDVARAARARYPDLPVVYISAYEFGPKLHAVPNSLLRAKPLRISELVHDILAYQTGRLTAKPERGEVGQAG